MTRGSVALLLLAAALTGGSALIACSSEKPKTTVSVAGDSARKDSIARVRQDSINRAQPGYVIDSIFPVEEELRRFRAAVGGTKATRFAGGSPTRDALVRRFVTAVVANDTAELQAMVIQVREFADLYYPESPYTHPPYHQSPALAWELIQNPSVSGLTRLVRRLGGQPMTYVSHRCDPKVLREGRNVRYAGCLLTIKDASGATVTKRYFGSIVERDGTFKFMSYSNQF